MIPRLRVHAWEAASRANGPGLRAVLWLQGCTLGCPGCFNPETHDARGGSVWDIADVLKEIDALPEGIAGLTISGGEPLQQMPALTAFLAEVRSRKALSVVVFTGFEWDEVQRMPGSPALLAHVDVLIAGRYRSELRIAHGLIGSANKTMHFLTDRYTASDFEHLPEAEVVLSADGQVTLSGIDPLHWG